MRGANGRLSLCIVGCGDYARTVLDNLGDAREHLELYFCSRDLAKAKEYSQTYGGLGYFGEYEEAAADPRVDALYFLTPHHLHLENALMAARHSKHILVEKPIARATDEATQMIEAASRAGVNLMVAENYRFNPAVEKCKQIIDEGRIGQLRLIQIQSEGYSAPTEWRTNAEMTGGGVFIDGGIHAVDLLLNIGGFPERVYAAEPLKVFRESQGEDGLVLMAHLPGGCVGIVSYSNGTPAVESRYLVGITGTRGHLSFSPRKDEITVETPETRRTVRVRQDPRGIRGMVMEFRNSILEDREPLMSGREGINDLAVVLAAYRSVRERREVALALPQV